MNMFSKKSIDSNLHARMAIEFNMKWRMVQSIAPTYKLN